MKVLITGFDPFDGETINPSFEAVKRLPNYINKYQIIKQEIPTVFGKSTEQLKAAIEENKPNIVICIGQSGAHPEITPEYVAINLEEARILDNEGNRPSGKSVIPSGENAYFSTLPVKAITKELISNEIPAKVSYTAGTFVCNHLFYGLMHMINTKYPNIKGGFIHVPLIPQQVTDKAKQSSLSLDNITKGLALAIKATIEHEKDIELDTGTEN